MSAFTDAAGLTTPSPLAPLGTAPGLGSTTPFDDAVLNATQSTGSYSTPKPAINPTPGGWLSNLYQGFTNMVDGVIGIGKAGIHDIVGGIQQVVPGSQSLEEDVEKNGYQIATIAKALPAALKTDYANRYGGVSNILRGLYEDPLAYIGDALMLAGGVGVAAKSGRAGAVLGHMPKIMPEGMATSVLGAGAEGFVSQASGLAVTTPYRAGMEVAATTLAEGATRTMTLSRNPLTRAVQKGMVGWASLDPIVAEGLLKTIPAAEHARIEMAVATAQAYGIRILRPKIGPIPYNPVETITKFWANRAATTSASSIKEGYNSLNTKYRNIVTQGHEMDLAQVKDADIPDVTESQLSNESIMGIISGDQPQTPLHLPANAGMEVLHTLPLVEDGVLPAPIFAIDPVTGQPLTQVFDDVFKAAESLGYKPGKGVDVRVKKGAEVPIEDRYTARTRGVQGTQEPQLTVYAGTMDDAPGMVERLAEQTGTTVEGVIDTTGDANSAMVEFTAALRNADGSLVHVSVATPRLARAQVAGEAIAKRTVEARAEAAQLLIEATRAAENGSTKAMAFADRANTLFRNADAGDKVAQRVFDVARREYHAGRSGVPYDPNLWVADAMAAEHYLDVTEPWIESGVGGPAPFARHMAHSFLPQRVRQYLKWESNILPKIEALIAGSPDNAAAYADLVRIFGEESGIPPALVEDILGNMPIGNFKDPKTSAFAILSRARNNLWDHVVTEGDRGAEFGFPEYDWTTMYDELAKAGLPIPGYYPAMASRKISDYAMQGGMGGGRISLRGASPGRYSKKARGSLWETGNVDPTIEDVFSKVAGFYLKTEEVKDLTRSLLARYQRFLTKAESQTWNPTEHLHEEVLSLKTLEYQLGVQARMKGDTLSNIALGMDPDAAIRKSFDNVLSSIVTDGIDTMTGDLVAMPKSVMDALRAQSMYQIGKGTTWLRGYNSLMQVWKKAVLSLRPTWLLNNMGGNSFFALVKDPAALRHMWHIKGDSMTERMMRVYFGQDTSKIISSGFFSQMAKSDFEELSKETAGSIAAKLESNTWTGKPYKGLSHASQKVYRMNGMIEQAARRGVFISQAAKEVGLPNFVRVFHSTETLIKEIMARGGRSGDEIGRASKMVNGVLGDYESFGPIEQYVVRQFLFPFYSFWRHATKFLVKMPFENPYKANILRITGLMDQQMYADWPDYLRSKVRVGDLGGEDMMVGLRGLNPLSFASDVMPLISNLNPLLKLSLERTIGLNTFTGQPFDDPGSAFTTHDGTTWVIERDGDGNPIGVHRSQGPVLPSWNQHVGSMLPQLSFIPSFSLYPKSFALQLANYVGVPLSETNLDQTVIYNQIAEQEAQSQMFTEALQ